MKDQEIIESLLDKFQAVRYAAIYSGQSLSVNQRAGILDASSGDSDKYEELLVNPTLLKLAEQRGNIDCGGLRFIIVGYGHFYQLIRSLPSGHISICLERNADINRLPNEIIDFLNEYKILG